MSCVSALDSRASVVCPAALTSCSVVWLDTVAPWALSTARRELVAVPPGMTPFRTEASAT